MTRRTLLLGALLGVANAAVAVLVFAAMSRHEGFGWFAYAPLSQAPPRLPDHRRVYAVVTASLVGLNVAVAAVAGLRQGRGGSPR